MKVNNKKLLEHLEKQVPLRLAEDWDKKNNGFIIGNPNKIVNRVMTCLEITEAIVSEAITNGIDLIVTHHPLLFRAVKTIRTTNPHEKLVFNLIQNDINVYVSHTAFDIADGCLNDFVADKLGIQVDDYIEETDRVPYYKITTFVPRDHMLKVRESMFDAGAGVYGDYSECGFKTVGTGSFRPGNNAVPVVGLNDEFTEVEEIRFETIVAEPFLKKVVSKLLKTHPYEEVAYDVLELENLYVTTGIGKVGRLEKKTTMKAFIEQIKMDLEIEHVKFIGDLNHQVTKVALITGAGDDYLNQVKHTGCDVFVTGDMKHQHAYEARELGLNIIDIGHFGSEKFFSENMKSILDLMIEDQDYDVLVEVSEKEVDPMVIL